MKSIEFESQITGPKTPDEQRIAGLKAAKDRAANALKIEKANQMARKARETLAVVNQIKPRQSGGD